MPNTPDRAAFEAAASAPPFERDIRRFPDDATKYAWPGNYRDIGVDFAWHMWQAALAAPAAAVAVPEDDAADLAHKKAHNIWDSFPLNVVPVLKAAQSGAWQWFSNTRCKYIEIRIDMRDLGCIIMDRERQRITPTQLAYQYPDAKPPEYATPQQAPAGAQGQAEDARDAAKYRELSTPEIHDFIVAVEREAMHQRDRWAASGDAGKTDADWFWLVGYLAGKALSKPEKRLHHIITTAAACLNWHSAAMGAYAQMRPGIADPDAARAPSAPAASTSVDAGEVG